MSEPITIVQCAACLAKAHRTGDSEPHDWHKCLIPDHTAEKAVCPSCSKWLKTVTGRKDKEDEKEAAVSS